MFATSNVDTIFSTYTGNIGTTLMAIIPDVLLIAAALIGLLFGIRWAKRWIGRSK